MDKRILTMNRAVAGTTTFVGAAVDAVGPPPTTDVAGYEAVDGRWQQRQKQ